MEDVSANLPIASELLWILIGVAGLAIFLVRAIRAEQKPFWRRHTGPRLTFHEKTAGALGRMASRGWMTDRLTRTFGSDPCFVIAFLKTDSSKFETYKRNFRLDHGGLCSVVLKVPKVFPQLVSLYGDVPEICHLAVWADTGNFQHLPPGLFSDECFVLSLVKSAPEIYRMLPPHCRKSRSVSLMAVSRLSSNFDFADKSLHCDKQFILDLLGLALESPGTAAQGQLYQQLCPDLQSDPDIVAAVAKAKRVRNYWNESADRR